MNKYDKRQMIDAWLFISPVVVGTIVFAFGPVIYSLLMSFTEWDGINPPEFNGFENFKTLLIEDWRFGTAVKNTAVFAVGSVPLAMIVGLFLAVLVNRDIPGRNAFRAAYFAPYVSSTVAIAMVFNLIYVPSSGLLNQLLSVVGISGPDWLGTTRWAMPSVILVQTWFMAGYNMVIFIAALQAIPESYYESATIDGAHEWQKFTKITVPLLSPTTFFLSVTGVLTTFQVFNLIYVLTQGGPALATTTYIHYLYLHAFQYFKMGLASTMAWIMFVGLVIVTVIQFRLQKRWVHYGS